MIDTIETGRSNGLGPGAETAIEHDAHTPSTTSPATPPTSSVAPSTPSKVGMPTAAPRARNTTWVVIGLILVVVAGIAASSLWRGLSDRVVVLVAADLIEQGQVITEADLVQASIAADTGIRAMSPDQLDELVGKMASGPIGAGSIVHPAQFIVDDAGDEPTVIVGAALEPGQYPIVGLLPGDRVRIIEVSSERALVGEEQEPREIAIGEIVEVAGLQQSDVYLVSLRIKESASLLISERAQQGRISIALLDAGFPEDLIDPIGPADPVEPGEPLDEVVTVDDDDDADADDDDADADDESDESDESDDTGGES